MAKNGQLVGTHLQASRVDPPKVIVFGQKIQIRSMLYS